MRKIVSLFLFVSLALALKAQNKIYDSYDNLLADKGDIVTTLHKVRRTVNQLYLSGGADYEIYSIDNKQLTKYLKKRCYAVRLNDTLYVNCRNIRYKKYRFGSWYAIGEMVKGKLYFSAQPLGQIASSSFIPKETSKLGGAVGDAINASGLVTDRVVYEIDPETKNAVFVGRERMLEILKPYPELLDAFSREDSESADVIGKYLLKLR